MASHLGVQTGPPYCYPVLFFLLTTHLLLSWLVMWSQVEARNYHHEQTSGSGADPLCLLHQRQLMSCGTMDQPDKMDKQQM